MVIGIMRLPGDPRRHPDAQILLDEPDWRECNSI
jgi:hypothetical protein